MALDFKNPPVNEVVIGIYFDQPISALRNQHIGLFWEKIREDFPKVQQQPPLGLPVEIGPPQVADEFFPMPRYWFISEDDTYVIQIDKGAFIFNWRRRESNEYPRFHKQIKPKFDLYYNHFNEFLRDELSIHQVAIGLFDLTYINLITPGDFWNGPQDTPIIIPSFTMPSCGLEQTSISGFACQYGYYIEPDMNVAIGIRSGGPPQQSGSPPLLFEIKTSSSSGWDTKSKADKWLERAHDSIMDCFQHMTSDEIQHKHWQREEGDP